MKKRVFTGNPPDFGWRNHKDSPVGYPTKAEAMEGFNIFIGWCVGQGLKQGDYSNFGLCLRLRKYMDILRNK